ncbi:MAG TPA: hypothetical protein VHW23_46425 [Kofleriaceae bacterium]|jgi:hypothetical protein|nr:hypothetical protein [Kofleriaceae bacterium]
MRARKPLLVAAVSVAVAGSALLLRQRLPTHPATRTADQVLPTPLQVPHPPGVARDRPPAAGGVPVSGVVVDQDGKPV